MLHKRIIREYLVLFWPYVNMYVRNLLFETVEPAVESALKAYKLNPFKFDRDRVFLGQVPPRITGIKVYDTNVSRKEIILDVDIVFASDLEVVFKVKGKALNKILFFLILYSLKGLQLKYLTLV